MTTFCWDENAVGNNFYQYQAVWMNNPSNPFFDTTDHEYAETVTNREHHYLRKIWNHWKVIDSKVNYKITMLPETIMEDSTYRCPDRMEMSTISMRWGVDKSAYGRPPSPAGHTLNAPRTWDEAQKRMMPTHSFTMTPQHCVRHAGQLFNNSKWFGKPVMSNDTQYGMCNFTDASEVTPSDDVLADLAPGKYDGFSLVQSFGYNDNPGNWNLCNENAAVKLFGIMPKYDYDLECLAGHTGENEAIEDLVIKVPKKLCIRIETTVYFHVLYSHKNRDTVYGEAPDLYLPTSETVTDVTGLDHTDSNVVTVVYNPNKLALDNASSSGSSSVRRKFPFIKVGRKSQALGVPPEKVVREEGGDKDLEAVQSQP